MTNTHQPRDDFLEELSSHPERMEALLRKHLPEAITKDLTDAPPELVPGSFVEEELREYFSDRLLKVKTTSGKIAFFYVLIEHKSTPDEKIGWHLLKSMVEILERWEKENPNWERLPAIIPFVFYHGTTKRKTPNEFLSLVGANERFKPYTPNFRIFGDGP